MPGRLDGRVVVVTGAARGLGLSMVERFTAEGADVVIADVDGDAAAEQARRLGADAVTCDVTDRPSVQALVDGTAARHGRLDVLVANAGLPGGGGLLEETDEGWASVLAVNLTGVFLCNQIAGRQLVAQGAGGAIVNMSSVMAPRPRAFTVAYGVTKAGVINLTQTAAIALGPHGVRVNAIGPGYMETRMTEPMRSDPTVSAAMTATVPLGRFGQPGDVADAAVFLASEESAYISGQVLYVDGGWLVHEDRLRPA